jgi:hypothetical protein
MSINPLAHLRLRYPSRLAAYFLIVVFQFTVNKCCFAQVKTTVAPEAAFLDEAGSPLEVVQGSGSVLVLMNVSDKAIVR